MAKIALLIGVSEYEPGLDGLPSAVNDVIAMQQVLTHPDMGGFADGDVTVLQNPDRQTMADEIYRLFANRQKEDLMLLYFSGHGMDDGSEFYFINRFSRMEQDKLIPSTALEARSVRNWMEQSRSQRKVIILDSCFSSAFARGVKIKNGGSVNPEQFLGGKGTAILTASTRYALSPKDLELSVYTHYLVEGIRTGGADQDDDGFIAMEELHVYASSKVKEAAPAMTPEFYPVKDGYKILLAKSPKDNPSLKYRKQVKLLAEEDEGDFSFINRHYLDELQLSLSLLPGNAAVIEAEELEPYRQRRAKVDRYRTVFEGAIAKRYPLTERDCLGLQRLQQLLSLRDEDVSAIQEQVIDSFATNLVPVPESIRPEKSDGEGGTDEDSTFERFTDRAIKVLMLAQGESRRLGHNFVGSEQILLGLIGVGTGIAAEILKSSGANSLKDVRAEVERMIGRGSGLLANEMPFTPNAKQILTLSLEKSRQLGHNVVDTEHLLLGVIQQGDGVAMRVLENLGVDEETLRSTVLQAIR